MFNKDVILKNICNPRLVDSTETERVGREGCVCTLTSALPLNFHSKHTGPALSGNCVHVYLLERDKHFLGFSSPAASFSHPFLVYSLSHNVWH